MKHSYSMIQPTLFLKEYTMFRDAEVHHRGELQIKHAAIKSLKPSSVVAVPV